MKSFFLPISALIILIFQFCKPPQPTPGPPGYAFDKPQKYVLKKHLHEISGLALYKLNPDTVYAIDDEAGKLFYFHPGDAEYQSCKFGEKGDYEDLTIWRDSMMVILRSDGQLSLFPLSESHEKKTDKVSVLSGLVPEGEYEGIFATGDSLLVMCKNCEEDSRKEVSIHCLKLNDSERLIHHSQWLIDVAKVPLTSINKKIKFHPSCLSRNPVTGEWYIISAVNRILIVLDEQWRIKNHYPLDAATFKQPEGITFDAAGDLFISNEGQDGDANLLFFKYEGAAKTQE